MLKLELELQIYEVFQVHNLYGESELLCIYEEKKGRILSIHILHITNLLFPRGF